ncbi:MAG: isochorismatase family protein [Deltaproteobacteria bacterium]|nr:isochorismatase family protein [Deltaproteobacteria bacterium]
MPLGVLITQCLQHDFVAPLAAGQPVPNPLHVGHAEARRLLGEDPDQGPLARFLRWAHEQEPETLQLVHIRDWHDAKDPSQVAHLARFGNHCLRESPGAAFVPGIDAARPNVHVVNAVDLNDFNETPLPQVLAELRKKSPDGALRVGVLGVWTDAKVSFLLYDLKTRGAISELATCSAFTASFSRAQHANALDQLNRLLDVRVDHSPGEFAAWLVDAPAAALGPQKLTRGAMVQVNFTKEPPEPLKDPNGSDRALLAYLYRNCREVTFRPLAGGFSGCSVLLAESVDAMGQRQAPSVAKVGPNRDVGFERAAFESIEAVLGNAAPSIIDFADDAERGAIRYRYAAMGKGDVRSFQKLYSQADASAPKVIREALGEVLAPLYAAATHEPLDLIEDYEFSPKWAPGVAKNVAALTDDLSSNDRLRIPGWGEAFHLARFYDRELARLSRAPGERHPVCMTHGDLNGQNILVDAKQNVWVIDFGRVRRGHALRDFAKLENDLLFIMTPVGDDLAQARALSELLAGHELGTPLPPLSESIRDEGLRRAHAAIGVIRELAGQVATSGYRVAMLRFAAHTLTFTEPTLSQRRWALGAASLLAERVAAGQR